MQIKTVKMADAMMQSYEAVKSIATAMNVEVSLFSVYTEENASQLGFLWSIAKNLIAKAANVEIDIIEQ